LEIAPEMTDEGDGARSAASIVARVREELVTANPRHRFGVSLLPYAGAFRRQSGDATVPAAHARSLISS
jgi:hypothetical protein